MIFIWQTKLGYYDDESEYTTCEYQSIEDFKSERIAELRKSNRIELKKRSDSYVYYVAEMKPGISIPNDLLEIEVVYLTNKELKELKSYQLRVEIIAKAREAKREKERIEQGLKDKQFKERKGLERNKYLTTNDCLCGFGSHWRTLIYGYDGFNSSDGTPNKCDKHGGDNLDWIRCYNRNIRI